MRNYEYTSVVLGVDVRVVLLVCIEKLFKEEKNTVGKEFPVVKLCFLSTTHFLSL